MIGLGKLGLPVALAMESCGHQVRGWDVNEETRVRVEKRTPLDGEVDTEDLLAVSEIEVVPVDNLLEWAELVFVAVQTPHEPRFEGITPLTDERADFDYAYLRQACWEIASAAAQKRLQTTMVVISTVLPGTMDREIKPLLNQYVDLVYSPSFIAMGTVVRDFLDPEFTLIGCDKPALTTKVHDFFRTIHERPILCVGTKAAELAKVAYNVLIGFKIAAVNTLAQVCEGTGTDVDAVTDVLRHATRRIWSPDTYFSAGMGDSGGCHPRDVIALSWLCQELELPADPFSDIMLWREGHAEWLADIIEDELERTGQQLCILGRSFKADTAIVTGSHALLLAEILADRGYEFEHFDPVAGPWPTEPFSMPRVFFVATKHAELQTLQVPPGSTVIDPWGYVERQSEVALVRPGRRRLPPI